VSEAELELLRSAPHENKHLFLVNLSDALPDDPLYRDLCAPSTFP